MIQLQEKTSEMEKSIVKKVPSLQMRGVMWEERFWQKRSLHLVLILWRTLQITSWTRFVCPHFLNHVYFLLLEYLVKLRFTKLIAIMRLMLLYHRSLCALSNMFFVQILIACRKQARVYLLGLAQTSWKIFKNLIDVLQMFCSAGNCILIAKLINLIFFVTHVIKFLSNSPLYMITPLTLYSLNLIEHCEAKFLQIFF